VETLPEIKINALTFIRAYLMILEKKKENLDEYFTIFITFIKNTSNVQVIIKSVEIS
jgi:hypothetical protein